MNLALLGLLLVKVCLAADPCQGRYPNNACPRDNSTIIYQDELLSRPGGKINLTCCFQEKCRTIVELDMLRDIMNISREIV